MTEKDDRIEKTVNVLNFFFVVDNCKRYNAFEFDQKQTVNIYRVL